MASEKLPWELVEEILSWVPLKSLARFRTVCKRWNALFEDKRFAKNHLTHATCPQFILFSGSKVFSVNVILNDCPSIEVHKLPLFIPGYRHSIPLTVDCCDGLLLCATSRYGISVCNPWLKQTRWIKLNEASSCFSDVGYKNSYFTGIGYDSSRTDRHYKIFTSHQHVNTIVKVWITEFESNTWKFHEFASENWRLISEYSVSLNGTLYWVACNYYDNYESHEYFIQSFDFSMEKFKPVCVLPGKSVSFYDLRSLEVFRRDRLSYLHQCYKSKNIEIWVTKRKIENEDGDAVEWMKFMNVSVPYSSGLRYMYGKRSYFIDGKSLSLVLYCWDHYKAQAYIYIAKEDKFKEIKIEDEVVGYRPCQRTYFPSLVRPNSFVSSKMNSGFWTFDLDNFLK